MQVALHRSSRSVEPLSASSPVTTDHQLKHRIYDTSTMKDDTHSHALLVLISRILNRSNIILKSQVFERSDDMLCSDRLFLLFLADLVGFGRD